MNNAAKKSRQYECSKIEKKAYDDMSTVVQDAIDTFKFVFIRSTWDSDRRSAHAYVCCKCNTCIEHHGSSIGGEFDTYCGEMSLNSIQDHLVSNGVIVNCKIDNKLVLSKKLVSYVKERDIGIPNNAQRVFWCDDHSRYFSYPHLHHCNDCHKGFASSERIDGHHCHHRKEHSFKVEDFPPLGEDIATTVSNGSYDIFKIVGSNDSVEVCSCGKDKTISCTVYKKMVNDMFLVTEAIESGLATGIENKYVRCWDCQQTQQHVIQPVVPDGYQWCDASVPVTYMTPIGPQVFMQETMILIRCM